MLLLLAVALASQPLAAALGQGQMDIVGHYLNQYFGEPTHASLAYVIAGGVVLGLLWIGLFLSRLKPDQPRRPLMPVFINHLATPLFLALALVAWDLGETRQLSAQTMMVAPAVLLGVPLLLLSVERLVAGLLTIAVRLAQGRLPVKPTLRLLRAALTLRPGDPELIRRSGLLLARDEQPEAALAMLERLGPEGWRGDEELLEALEHAWRVNDYTACAVECLELMRALRPTRAGLARRILDDYLALGRSAEALGLLESGQLRMDFPLIRLRQQLLIESGQEEQALAHVDRIAQREGPPHKQAMILFQELLEQRPDHLDLRVRLGRLKLKNTAEPCRREGAILLEQVLAEDPTRLELARQLADFYLERKELNEARVHLQRLTREGDTHPDSYLQLARIYHEEENFEDAARVLGKMTRLLPADWRGHFRLARALFALGRLEEAEHEFNITAERVPADARAQVEHLRSEIEAQKRQLSLAQLTREMSHSDGTDLEERLHIIDEMIDADWIDKALDLCDQLREQHPETLPRIEALIQQGISRVQRNFRLSDYLGDLYYQQRRFDDLLELCRTMASQSLDPPRVLISGCEKILSRQPDHHKARIELAQAHRARRDYKSVITTLEPLLQAESPELEPLDMAMWVEACWKLNRLDEALAAARPLLDELAQHTGFLLMVIEILEQAGELGEAHAVLRRGLEANPDDTQLRQLERTLTRRWQTHRLAELEALNRADALTPTLHLEKAELHAGLNEYEKAIVHFQRASEEQALARVAMVRMASTLVGHGMFDLAQEVLEPIEVTRELVAENPEIKDLIYQIARQFERIKRPAAAVKLYKRLFHIDASFEDVVHRLEKLT